MKRSIWIILAVTFVVLGGQALAFHDGGVAECSGCHKMHLALSPSYLLQGTDQSSACLNCHENTSGGSYHMSTALAQMPNDGDPVLNLTPGGDFGWLRKDLDATASYGRGLTFLGKENGHNIVAADHDYLTTGDVAPGGTMSSDDLYCTSCHDPHGNARITGTGAAPVVQYPSIGNTHDPIVDSGSYGAEPTANEAVGIYRLLGAAGYQPSGVPAAFPGAPPAVSPSSYNRSEASNTTRVSYGYSATADGFASWGRWCATCHPDYHTDTAGFKHKVDEQLSGAIVNVYDNYVKTGDLTGTFPRGGPFTSLVPFALNTKSIPDMAAKALIDDSDMTGPTTMDRMTCFTCHRAHASGWPYALRWNGEAEFLTLGGFGAPIYPGTDAGLGNQGQFNRGYSVAQMETAYGGRAASREFAAHQRSLCNKCHMQD